MPYRVLQILEVEIVATRCDLTRVVEQRHVEKTGRSPAQLGVHQQAVPIAKAKVRIAAQRRAAPERREQEVRNVTGVLDVSDRRDPAQRDHPVCAQDRNELHDFSFERLKRIQVVVALAEIVELRAQEPAASGVTESPAPVECRAGRAVDIAEFGELEPRRIGGREHIVDRWCRAAGGRRHVVIVDPAAERELPAHLDIQARSTRHRGVAEPRLVLLLRIIPHSEVPHIRCIDVASRERNPRPVPCKRRQFEVGLRASERVDGIAAEDVDRAVIAKRLPSSNASCETAARVDRAEPRIETSRRPRDHAPIFQAVEKALERMRLRRLELLLSRGLLLANDISTSVLRERGIDGDQRNDADDRDDLRSPASTLLVPDLEFLARECAHRCLRCRQRM